MKIAIPVNNELINEHFGHSESFLIYSISRDNQVESVTPAPSLEGCGCKSGIAQILAEQGVSVMLVGNIGGGAINHLNGCGIEVIRGCHGRADLAITSFLAGKVTDNNQTCSHHEGCEEH